MNTEYVTETGVVLQIGRIPRQVIDRFVAEHPCPEPPMIAVETWAGDEEEVPNYEAPEYQQEMGQYWLELGKGHVVLIADAVTLPGNVDFSELAELMTFGLGSAGSPTGNFLRYMATDNDVQAIVGQVLYNSTVTDRAMLEASARYNVTWHSRQLSALTVFGKSPGRYGVEFEARRAAQFSRMGWGCFCKLDGPEQSAVVAFFRLSNSLAWLQSKRGSKQ